MASEQKGQITLTADDCRRLEEIAGEIEHLPNPPRNFNQDGRDARYLRILVERAS